MSLPVDTVIDAHQHVWDLERAEYAWLDPKAGVLYRSFEMDEVLPEFEAAGVTGSVLVQSADNDEDTDHLFEVARRSPRVLGVVGYVPLHEPERAAARLAVLQREPHFCGIRNLMHERPDPDWIRRPEVDEGLGILEDAGVAFDVVAVLPEHLRAVITVSERHPRLRMVLDHLGRPPVGAIGREPWAGLIAEAAANPLVFAKVSGLYSTVGDPTAWTADGVRPFFDHAVDAFGPGRLMYGGDWPVSLLAGGYARVWSGIRELVAGLEPVDRRRILAGTAQDFYGIQDSERTVQG